jgi:hypothetical protein
MAQKSATLSVSPALTSVADTSGGDAPGTDGCASLGAAKLQRTVTDMTFRA